MYEFDANHHTPVLNMVGVCNKLGADATTVTRLDISTCILHNNVITWDFAADLLQSYARKLKSILITCIASQKNSSLNAEVVASVTTAL